MNVNIYADEMLFINFIINMAVIFISEKILSKKIRIYRIITASVVISLISFIAVISPLRVYINFLSITAVNMIAAIFLFSPVRIRDFVKYTAVIKISSVFINETYLVIKQYSENGYFTYFLIFSAVLAYIAVIVFKHITKESACYYNVNIICNDKSVSTIGFVDTGNSLVEPISKKPVIIAEFNAIKELLPEALAYIYDKEGSLSEIIEAISDDNFRRCIRIIPFKSIGNENGILIGFVADRADIGSNCIKKPVVAIYRCPLSKGGGYNTLLSPRHLGGV